MAPSDSFQFMQLYHVLRLIDAPINAKLESHLAAGKVLGS
jgi:hypothetical protein